VLCTLQYFCHWECCFAAVVGTCGNFRWYPAGDLYFVCVWFLLWLVSCLTCVPFLICIWSSWIFIHCFCESAVSFVLCIYYCMCYILVRVLCCCSIGPVGYCECSSKIFHYGVDFVCYFMPIFLISWWMFLCDYWSRQSLPICEQQKRYSKRYKYLLLINNINVHLYSTVLKKFKLTIF
jgi:hypothetical protein